MSLLREGLAETRRKRLAANEALDFISSSSESEEELDNDLSEYYPESTESGSDDESQLITSTNEEINHHLDGTISSIINVQKEPFNNAHFSEIVDAIASENTIITPEMAQSQDFLKHEWPDHIMIEVSIHNN